MSICAMNIEFIHPKFLNNGKNIEAHFTLKNSYLKEEEAFIKGLNLGFNTGDNKKVIKTNRATLFGQLNVDPQNVAFANQVHGNRVKEVTKGGTYAETDGLVTQIPGLSLAIQVADCAAVLIADPHSQIIAAVHAGWRGAAGNIVPQTLQKIKGLGGQLTTCKAFISPCIGMENFEIGMEVAEQFPGQFVDYNTYQKPHLNLKGFLKHQLVEYGVRSEYIEIHGDCTIQEEEHYYSYRREGTQSGRMMGIIQLTEVKV